MTRKPEEPSSGSRGSYYMTVWCVNCLRDVRVKIPHGMLVETFVKTGKCSNCGCSVLKRSKEAAT